MRFILVRPTAFEAHLAFCSSLAPTGSASSCRGGFWKYWSRVHFHRPIYFYHLGLTSLSPKEVKMKEDLYVCYKGIEYEEGFGSCEVFSFQQKKR